MNVADRLSEAIQNARDGDWSQLERFSTDLEKDERERREAHAHLRHEIGNLLSIAQASIEGIADGVVTATPERLRSIREALVLAGDALNAFRPR